jgi:parallel beta-helix repeat protein
MMDRFTRASCCTLLALFVANAAQAASQSGDVAGCDVIPAMPAPPAKAKLFRRSGAADDTADIQKAIRALRSGDWLVLPAGTYRISKHLTVPVDGVTLYGKGATIRSTNATDGGIMIEGDNVAIYGFTLEQNSDSRQGTPWAGGISVFDQRSGKRRRVSGTVIRGNTINNAANTGIFLYRATLFTVADNIVYRSWADGIHATGGSDYGRIIRNRVSQNGDDMIAVVSYAGERGALPAAMKYRKMSLQNLNRDIYVAGNTLSDTYWGRGISVVGGINVTIQDNDISKTPTAAGIYVLRERSYATFGGENIVIRNNRIGATQTAPPTYKPASVQLELTRHGAIEVSSQMNEEEFGDPLYRNALMVSRVAILDNTIRGARFAGMRFGAVSGSDKTVTNIVVKGNRLEDVGLDSIAEIHGGVDRTSLSCSQNELNDSMWASNCDGSGATARAAQVATGATLRCLADGTVRKPVTPGPPAGLMIRR